MRSKTSKAYITVIAFVTITILVLSVQRANQRGNKPQQEEKIQEPIGSQHLEPPPKKMPSQAEPRFDKGPLPAEIIERIFGLSWREGSPVRFEDLSYISVSYWGFDGREHRGELVAHREVSGDLVDIFQELYDKKYPIEKIRLVDEYGADDDRSMADNNTSAFNYRVTAGGSQNLSKHSYGIAIDINPVQNPYVKGNNVLPPNGWDYRDRQNIRPGMIIRGDACYTAFKKRGWLWGGDWKTMKDYQHFYKPLF